MEELKKIKDVVKEVLGKDEKTRNSDTWLIIQTLRKMGFNIYVDYHDIKDMPSLESITRSRRYWQNDKKEFLPTEKVGALRDKMQDKYKEVFI